ncbi:lipoprotein signal peptidase [Caenibius tardaugens NBRC 16725]|uniref:Lipoprotein signal peptidase n=1 Tax=Caenibius tardaugens NBRC 16725 TaxID=1219035 RepID=U2Y737_9SPHN|nr:signal peptidase II [Caenibius tardaugens]AZI35946.1 signal peptidase II [Caenibius tardaugens NBRC 16725]GAD49001.1 lipoprotein signal peptidase [Caenibius tardaugens NBRC 16725]
MSWLTRNRIIGLLMAAALFAVDQYIKWLMVGPLQLRERGVIDLLPFFDLRWTQNFGVSLGMLTADSVEMRWILVAMTGLIALAVFIWMLREKAMWDIAALAFVLGGALGNIRDRFLLGYVIDYADLHIGDFRPFLIFNVADAAITIGVVIILARSFFLRDKREQTDTDDTTDDRGNSPAET